jgi:oxygen-independent coproporphyrinogen-3 oxidase
MCHFETHFQTDSPHQDTHIFIREKLQPLIADELLELDEETVKVTTKGQAFIRNICMAFDLDLHGYEGNKPLFSATI